MIRITPLATVLDLAAALTPAYAVAVGTWWAR